MTLLRGVDGEIASTAGAFLPHLGRGAIARALERYEIGFRSSARQDTERFATVTDQLGKPANDLRFNHCRRWAIAPGAGVLIERRTQRVGPDANRQRRGIELTKVMRTRDLHRMWRNVAGELIENLLGRRPRDRQRLVE